MTRWTPLSVLRTAPGLPDARDGQRAVRAPRGGVAAGRPADAVGRPQPLGALPVPELDKLDLRWNRFLEPPGVCRALAERGCVVLLQEFPGDAEPAGARVGSGH